MPAYVIFIREEPVKDEAAMAEYSKSNRAAAAGFQADYGIRPLSVYGALEALEGEDADGVVLLEFPTMAQARAWYDSPEYQKAIGMRQSAASYRALLFEGL